jgi:tRNA pseudouridine38-40 synthase
LEMEQLTLLVGELNSYLPRDIFVNRIFPVIDGAHARFDAVSRSYQYFIQTLKNPFNSDFAWHFYIRPDIDLMNEASVILLNYSDFTSFSKLHTDVKTNNCVLKEASWSYNNGLLVFTITADRFLRNMVRAIVGTLVDVGRKKITIENLKEIIESKNRQNAGMSVPAKGLFLHKIVYRWEEILLQSNQH